MFRSQGKLYLPEVQQPRLPIRHRAAEWAAAPALPQSQHR